MRHLGHAPRDGTPLTWVLQALGRTVTPEAVTLASRHFPLAHRALFLAVVLLVGSVAGAPGGQAAEATDSGFRALTGSAAESFVLPTDVRLRRHWKLRAVGLDVQRYQQVATRYQADVDGGQLTIYRRAGVPVLVVGAHYPAAAAANSLAVSPGAAVTAAAADDRLQRPNRPLAADADASLALTRQTSLHLDPGTARLYFRVETSAPGVREVHSVDAETGVVFHALDLVTDDHGVGVKKDTKSLVGGPGAADDLTSLRTNGWRMKSSDGRLAVYDARNSWELWNFPPDADNEWTSSYQRAAVDAQYYARATDQFVRQRLGLDLLADCGYPEISSVVHVGSGYANAFWDGRYLVYGDGDGALFGALSGAQDVVSHELGHAVTECTSALLYENEPGALNEAFSDILATVAEFALAEPKTSNCRREAGQSACPDWWIAEDAWLGGGQHGLRSLGNPAAGDQPSHYGARYKGSSDNGGVHINSGIANHAFYLLAQGGRNARCAGPGDAQADCDVAVPGIGMADAADLTLAAYVGLPEAATFCDARAATAATAAALHPGSDAHQAAVELSWAAVGLDAATCGAGTGFWSAVRPRSAAVGAGGTARQLEITVNRGAQSGPLELSLKGIPAGWYGFLPKATIPAGETTATITLAVPPGSAAGAYPLTITVTSAARISRTYAALVIDDTPPAISGLRVRLAQGTVISSQGATAPVAVSWSVTDDSSGVVETKLELSTDGGPWNDVTPAGSKASPLYVQLGSGAHRFRVKATDGAGNNAVSGSSAPVTLQHFQEGAAIYSSGWSAPVTPASWGSVRYAKTSLRTATFKFTGDEIAWVAATGPKRGKAKVYLDGALVATVSLQSATDQPRTVVFAADGLSPAVQHKLRIVTKSPAGRPRVDVDGFLTLRR